MYAPFALNPFIIFTLMKSILYFEIKMRHKTYPVSH